MCAPELRIAFLLSACLASTLHACPYCKVARDEQGILDDAGAAQAATGQAATSQPDKNALRFGVAFDFASGYFHHGYMMQDRGLVFQPSVSVSTQPIVRGDWVFEPYLVWTNTFNTHESPGYAGGHDGHSRTEQQYQQYLDEPHEGAPFPHFHSRLVDVISYEKAGGGWFETELRPGVRITRGPLALDLLVKGHVYPSDFHDTIIEIGAKVSYELESLWSEEKHPDFGLRATTFFVQEVKDDNGSLDTIIESTLEPIYRFNYGGKRGSISLPITLGMSPNGFYRDSDYGDAFFGFTSLGMEVSLPLPVDEKYGRWFLNAGVTGYQMLSDSAEFANGDSYRIVGHVGFGVAF